MSGSYDVFLSHNRKDKLTVRPLAQALQARGLQVWLDEEQLVPGRPWQKALEEIIQTTRTAAVLVGKDGLGPWEIPEMRACLSEFVDRRLPVIPVLLPDAPDKPDLPLFLRAFTWVDLRGGLTDDNLDQLEWGITGSRPTKPFASPPAADTTAVRPSDVSASEANPYDPWTPVVPPHFVGREDILRRLDAALEEKRSISLVGDWRIGKSSVLATWEQRAREKGRTVRCVNGEGGEGTTPGAFVRAITGLPAPDEPDPAAEVLDGWARAMGRPGLPPLVLVDEADGLFVRFEHRLFERMRAMLGRIVLVVTSRKEVDRVCQELGQTSPFLNRLELIRLGLLETAAAEALIGQGARFFQPGDAELLRQQAGRHPFYLQLLGRHLVEANRNGEGRQDALDQFYAEARIRLREWWHTLDAREQQDLRGGLVESPVQSPPMVLQGKKQFLRLPIHRKSLRLRGLVTEEGQLFGAVLADWLREEL